jgi:hypothetical protein
VLNTVLYNCKEGTKDEVNKRKGTIPTATPSAVIGPKLSTSNNISAVPNSNALFDRKIDFITEGIDPFFGSKLRELSEDNALTIFITRDKSHSWQIYNSLSKSEDNVMMS